MTFIRIEHGPVNLVTVAIVVMVMLMIFLNCHSKKEAEPVSQVVPEIIAPNTLTEAEEAAGWKLLFDGRTFKGWTGLGRDRVPEGHWLIEDGMINKVASGAVPLQADGQPIQGGDLMTIDTFENFELAFEWKISPGGNSGVKYNVSEELSTSHPPKYAALGFEYQVLDDEKHPDADNPTHQAGSLYDMIAPQNKQLRPVGEFNQSRIVFNGNHGEHWLNGIKVIEFELGTPEFASLLAASKYKDIVGFGQRKKGHIVLQDHTDEVWYRSIKIKVLP